jgi:hypothetical protein
MCYYFGKTKFAIMARDRYVVEAEDAENVQSGQENNDRKQDMQIASASLTIPTSKNRSAA